MQLAKAYLAGTGATSALVAAAVVSFFALAGLFSVNGFPGGLSSSEGDTVMVAPGTDAPEAAAAAAAAAPGAVAATPADRVVGGAGVGGAGVAGAGESGATLGGATAPGGGATPGSGTAPGATLPTGSSPSAPAPAPTPASGTSTQQGPLSDTVSGVEGTTEGATGVDVPLSETTQPLTNQLDQTIQDTNDTVGGLLGGNN
jgi:hypothetical protein